MDRVILKRQFETDGTIEVDESRLLNVTGSQAIALPHGGLIETRLSGELTNRAFFLPNQYDWVLGMDSEGSTVLIPLLKSGFPYTPDVARR